MKIIPTYIHGILDYLVGIVLFAAPNIFGFADVGGAAVVVPRLIGALIVLQSVLTRYELGLVKVIPMRIHLGVDYFLTLVLALSPWLFGFADEPGNAWMPHFITGAVGFGLALMTEREPRARAIHHHAH